MSDTSITLHIHLNVRQDEDSFNELFLAPIKEALEISELGEITSHERITNAQGEPTSATLTLRVPELADKQITGLITLLEQFGAPKGSVLVVKDGATHQVGQVSGIALYLDGVNLDKKIYKKYDFDKAWDAVNNELKDQGMAYGHWEGKTETAIYAYGADVDAMQANLERLLIKHPLFRGVRNVNLPTALDS